MMPAGRYYIGDLCYVIEEWNDVCLIIQGDKCVDGEFTLPDGRRFANYGTAYGDGRYHSNIGTEHPVDSGRIGCLKVEDITKDVLDATDVGAVVDFASDFETGVDDGVISFGHVEISTDPDRDDDYEDDEDYDDED